MSSILHNTLVGFNALVVCMYLIFYLYFSIIYFLLYTICLTNFCAKSKMVYKVTETLLGAF